MKSMKLASFSVIFLVQILLSGCIQNTELAKMEDANIATIKHIHAEIAKGNIEVFDEFLTSNYVRHCQAMPPELQEMYGTSELKAFVGEYISACSNFKETFDVIVADSNMVAYQTTMTATQTGPMGGRPASGKEFKCVNIIIQRFEEGKIAETWVTWDNLAVLSQVGFFPPPEAKN